MMIATNNRVYLIGILLLVVAAVQQLLLLDPMTSVSAIRPSSTTTKMATKSSLLSLPLFISTKDSCRDHHQASSLSYNNQQQQQNHHQHHQQHQSLYFMPQQRDIQNIPAGNDDNDKDCSYNDDDENLPQIGNNSNKKNVGSKTMATTTKTMNNNNININRPPIPINDHDNDTNDSSFLSLQEEAEKLRKDAESLKIKLEETKKNKIERERVKVDKWIDELLLIDIESTTTTTTSNRNTGKGNTRIDLLKNTDQVYQYMMQKRYSSEQVFKIFNRLSEIRLEETNGRSTESRSNCSPLMSLLIDATNKLDCTERHENPNKRWKNTIKVEQILQKKLFGRDWNIEYISEHEEE
mmetsp:Transcript_1321/g.1408  ORF Transcript_1321/g.1408 Transcript_1321/m.1408 type:complete len:352 (-) Transcript_1321:104-1159(-)